MQAKFLKCDENKDIEFEADVDEDNDYDGKGQREQSSSGEGRPLPSTSTGRKGQVSRGSTQAPKVRFIQIPQKFNSYSNIASQSLETISESLN